MGKLRQRRCLTLLLVRICAKTGSGEMKNPGAFIVENEISGAYLVQRGAVMSFQVTAAGEPLVAGGAVVGLGSFALSSFPPLGLDWRSLPILAGTFQRRPLTLRCTGWRDFLPLNCRTTTTTTAGWLLLLLWRRIWGLVSKGDQATV